MRSVLNDNRATRFMVRGTAALACLFVLGIVLPSTVAAQLINQVVIHPPSPAQGTYLATGANFGPPLTLAGVSGSVELVNDGSGLPTDGCSPLIGFSPGAIALVDRGGCLFTLKVANAQTAGAVAVIVVNNVSGTPTTLGGSDPTITIPSVMTSLDNGNAIKAGLPANGTISLRESRATFKVYKFFNDDNPADVIVHLDCNGGLIPDQDQNVAEGHPVEFIVTEFEHGNLDCTITESTPIGYAANYRFFELGERNSLGCEYTNIINIGSLECWIDNEVVPIEFDVRKLWYDEHPEFNNSTFARAQYHCDHEAEIECGSPGAFTICQDETAFYGHHLWFKDKDDYDTFEVFPHWDGKTTCTVREKVRDSSVESDDSDCYEVPVLLGQDVSPADDEYECTIINTRIYEGIPTLTQYGLALLALLMLGFGLVGFRRFA